MFTSLLLRTKISVFYTKLVHTRCSDRADNGEQIIVQRGKNKADSITPITQDDLYFTPEMLARIDISIKQAEEGKTTTTRT